jgi:hypothetical protein
MLLIRLMTGCGTVNTPPPTVDRDACAATVPYKHKSSGELEPGPLCLVKKDTTMPPNHITLAGKQQTPRSGPPVQPWYPPGGGNSEIQPNL